MTKTGWALQRQGPPGVLHLGWSFSLHTQLSIPGITQQSRSFMLLPLYCWIHQMASEVILCRAWVPFLPGLQQTSTSQHSTLQVPMPVHQRPFSRAAFCLQKNGFEWSYSGSVPKKKERQNHSLSSVHTDAVNVTNHISKWLAASENTTFATSSSALNSYQVFLLFSLTKGKHRWWKLM